MRHFVPHSRLSGPFPLACRLTESSTMSLSLPDRWVWDFWFAHDGDEVHVFYLQAPRSLGDPELRHHNATIGHAVSRDLRSWEVFPDALGPGADGEFDSLATWTGSVVRHAGEWHMFYTGVSRAEEGKVQRVGVATSSDLVTWTKQGMLLEADPRWYERLHAGVREEAWRDPWVWHEPSTGRFHMLLTARANHGPIDGRGVVGHAVSDDLRTWEALPPVSEPGEFYHLEVPQLVHLGGAWRVAFCLTAADHSSARRARPGFVAEGGTHVLTGAGPLGPFELEEGPFLLGDPHASLYAGRFVEHDGAWFLMAWEHVDVDGAFVGRLSDPMPVSVGADGRITVVRPS